MYARRRLGPGWALAIALTVTACGPDSCNGHSGDGLVTPPHSTPSPTPWVLPSPVAPTPTPYHFDPSAVPAIAPLEIVEALWMGKDSDYVTLDSGDFADGHLDGHFQIVVDFRRSVRIKHIEIWSQADAAQRTRIWSSRFRRKYGLFLGVYKQDTPLNTTYTESLGIYDGRQVFDLYATDVDDIYFEPSPFRIGNVLSVMIVVDEPGPSIWKEIAIKDVEP